MIFYDIVPPEKLKKFAKEEILGIKTYKTQREKYFAFGWRMTLVLAIISVSIFLSLSRGSLEAQEQIKIIPTSFSSDWQNPELAFDQDLTQEAAFEEFNQGNSAHPLETSDLLSEETVSLEKETEFTPEVPSDEPISEETKETEEQNLEGGEENEAEVPGEREGSTDQEQQEGSAEHEESEPEPTSFWDKIRDLFWGTAQAQEENQNQAHDNEELPVDGEVLEEDSVLEEEITPIEKTLELYNFSVSEDFSKKEIRNVQLRLSLAAKGTPNDYLIIEYYYKENWQSLASFNLESEISNNLNGGYFLYALPILENWWELEDLRVRFRYLQQGIDKQQVYLDAVWLEVEYGELEEAEGELTAEEIEKLPRIEIGKEKAFKLLRKDFQANEEPEFEIDIASLETEYLVTGQSEIPPPFEESITPAALEETPPEETPSEETPVGEVTPTEEEASPETSPEAVPESTPVSTSEPTPEPTPEVTPTEEAPAPEPSSTPIEENENSNSTPFLNALPKILGVKEVFAQTPQIKILKAEVFNPRGTKIDILPEIEENGDKISIHVPKPVGSFKPGKYRIAVELLVGEKVFVSNQEFTWGVLAINTNKSIYLPNETAYLQIAALKDDGHTLCNARLGLQITDPDSQVIILSTEDGSIQYSGECGPDNVTDVPDYFVYYQVGGVGNYQIKLTNLDNGYEIEDSLEVRESVPFDVERIGPTRIYPPATYEITFRIKTNQDFSGQVIESMPAGFVVKSSTHNSFKIYGSLQEIVWNVDWKAGETHELKYTFDAPDISPYLYLLGPVSLQGEIAGEGLIEKIEEILNLNKISFKEMRQWQIAADAQLDFEDFEAGWGVWTDQGGTCYWQRHVGDLGSGSTGADYDHTYGDTSHYKISVECSNSVCQGSDLEADIVSSTFDADAYAISISFWYHMYGSNMGDLHLDVNDGTWHNDVMTVLSGQQEQGSETAAYTYHNPVDLSAYTGDITIRFRYDNVGGYRGDIALDDIEITGELKVEVPDAPTLYNLDDSAEPEQISFNNIEQNTTTPRFRVSTTHTEAFDKFKIEVNTATDFTGTAYTQEFTEGIDGYTSGTKYNLLCDSLGWTPSNGTTYYVRAQASADNGANWGDWSTENENECCETWSFTYKSASEDLNWFHTTDEQFATGTLLSTQTSGSDSVELGSGAIAKAGTDTNHTDGGDVSSTSFSHTLASGSNRMVVVSISIENNGDYDVSTITYGGTTMTKAVDEKTGTSDYICNVEVWYILESALTAMGDGSKTIEITFSATGSTDMEINAVAAEYTGVAQGVPEATDSTVWSSGTSITNTISPSTDAWVVSAVGWGNSLSSEHGQGQVEIYDIDDVSSGFAVAELRGASGETSLDSTASGSVNRGIRVAASWTGAEVSSGTIMSPEIDFDWATGQSSWGAAAFSTTETYGDVKLRVYYTVSTACDTIVPDGVLSGNSSGFDVAASPVNISGLTPVATTYNKICLQATLLYSSGTPYLNDWSVSWGVGGNQAPTVDSISIDPSPINLNADTTKTITITATITDNDGCEDVFTSGSITGVFFDDAAEDDTCSQDDNDCYANLTLTEVDDTCSGAGDYTADASVNVDVWFIANPSSSWTAKVTAIDEASASDSDTQTVTINTLIAFKLDTSSIPYGAVNPDEVSSQQGILITTTGNAAVDVQLSGSNLTWSGNTILVGQQKYSASSGFNWETQGTALTGTPACHELSTGKPTAHPSNQSENVYWKLKVPTGKPAGGPYSGTNTFDVVSDSACP